MDEQPLKDAVTAFVHKYLDVQPDAENVIVDWALQTWKPLPYEVKYLRFMGNYGTGKTRAGEVMVAICKNAARVTGYSTMALLLQMDEKGIIPVLDDFNLANDEFKTILAVGNIKNTGVVFKMIAQEGKCASVPFDVFGYKIICSRQPFRDDALEARCITVHMSGTDRIDIPRVLDGEFEKDKADIQSVLQEFYAVGGVSC